MGKNMSPDQRSNRSTARRSPLWGGVSGGALAAALALVFLPPFGSNVKAHDVLRDGILDGIPGLEENHKPYSLDFSRLGEKPRSIWDQDIVFNYGLGSKERKYFTGKFDPNRVGESFAVLRGNTFFMNFDFDGHHNARMNYGVGDSESQYFLGLWDVDKKRYFPALRRGNKLLIDTDGNGKHDIEGRWGNGDNEGEYATGDVDGDGQTDFIIRNGCRFKATTSFNLNEEGGFETDERYKWSFGCEERGSIRQYVYNGNFGGDNRDDIAYVLAGKALIDTDMDGKPDMVWEGLPENSYLEYYTLDANGDGTDELAWRDKRKATIHIANATKKSHLKKF